MNNVAEIKMYRDDFRVALFSLMECQTAWRIMIDENNLPDFPGMDVPRAQHMLIRFSEVREKIEAILNFAESMSESNGDVE